MSDDRPLGPLDDEELLRRLGAALRAEAPVEGGEPETSASAPSERLRARVHAAVEREAFGTSTGVTHLAPRGRATRMIGAAAAVVALAASFALVMRAPAHDLAIPAYEAELATADAEMRGAEVAADACATCGALRVSGDRFVLVARPKVAPSAPVSARAFLFRAGAPLPWSPPITVGSEGVVRIAGNRAELLPKGEGDFEVVVAAGDPASLPTDALAARRAVTSPAPGYRAVSVHFSASP